MNGTFKKELLRDLKKANITGYMYSMWGGKLDSYEGYLMMSARPGRARFYKIANDTIAGSLMCSNKPGVIVNSVVWLKERDDKKAAELLIQYERTQIEQCKMRIRHHEAKIKMLEETYNVYT